MWKYMGWTIFGDATAKVYEETKDRFLNWELILEIVDAADLHLTV